MNYLRFPRRDESVPPDDFETAWDTTVRDAYQAAWDAARADYLSANPAYSSANTGCPRHPCVALPGVPCTDGPVGSTQLGYLHQARSKLLRERNKLRLRLADQAGRAAAVAYRRSVGAIPGDAHF